MPLNVERCPFRFRNALDRSHIETKVRIALKVDHFDVVRANAIARSDGRGQRGH
jgi:hypothetical protein